MRKKTSNTVIADEKGTKWLRTGDLGTVDEDCGVLKAMCTRCRDYMHTTQKTDELQCNTCNKKERRKVSKNYVND